MPVFSGFAVEEVACCCFSSPKKTLVAFVTFAFLQETFSLEKVFTLGGLVEPFLSWSSSGNACVHGTVTFFLNEGKLITNSQMNSVSPVGTCKYMSDQSALHIH